MDRLHRTGTNNNTFHGSRGWLPKDPPVVPVVLLPYLCYSVTLPLIFCCSVEADIP